VLRAFEAGADDVNRWPFVHAELLARVQALMRRGILSSAGVIQFGVLRIDTHAHDDLLRKLWGYQAGGSTRALTRTPAACGARSQTLARRAADRPPRRPLSPSSGRV